LKNKNMVLIFVRL